MPTLEIDGQQVTVAAGSTVIQAAEKLGIYIPRYCYHPGLSIAGSCRMCLVEIEKLPKLQIACYTPVADGMKVRTDTAQVVDARKHMLEFLLTNHPLDCPVCDQSGECDLQNFYMEYGRYESRFLEDKIKRRKAVPLGPHVVLDQERCILCSRCIRFTQEISKSHELGLYNRGNRSVIDLQEGKTLDNPYSGNVIDICPVGALTERQFRFKCRVWYLGRADSICTGCSRGCNVTLQFNASGRGYKAGGKRIQRLKPRYNPEVNDWWMCDEGRFGFEFIDRDRIEFAYRRRGDRLEPADPEAALSEAATAAKTALEKFGPDALGVIASPRQSNEELYLLEKIFRQGLGVQEIGLADPWEKEGFQDDYLVRGDKNPNRAGGEALGLDGDVGAILERAASGQIKVLFVFRHEFADEAPQALLKQAPCVVYFGTNWNPAAKLAHVVLPSATHAESNGTFTNCEGRVQRFERAVEPQEESRPEIQWLGGLAEKLGHPVACAGAEDVFAEWYGKPCADLEEFGETREATAV